jgi:hypothetical protein
MGARVVLSLDGSIVTELELDKPVVVVGRHPACDLCIDHPAISGRHMLFRQVGTTVYMEDLASTNGTKVNGIATVNQVVKHLDLIEAGRHKLHFFDDALLAGEVGNLEKTVHTDFERTMMVQHVPEPTAKPQPARTGGEDLSRTMAIPRDSALRLGAAQEAVDTRAQTQAAGPLGLRVVAGPRVGETIALSQSNTMLGASGSDTALVVKRGDGFYLARFGGNAPRLNRRELGPGTHRMAAGDRIDVGASCFEVIQLGR